MLGKPEKFWVTVEACGNLRAENIIRSGSMILRKKLENLVNCLVQETAADALAIN